MTRLSAGADETRREKVVIRFESETVKGYIETPTLTTLEDLFERSSDVFPTSLQVLKIGNTQCEDISVDTAKAIFYVKEFDGNPRHKDLLFYTHAPIAHGIWVRVEFLDGELLEGIVQNTIRHLLDPGFFLRPTDPNSNNKMVYVLKSSLKDYRILGLGNR